MLAFEVAVNGQVLYVAGMENWPHMSTHVRAATHPMARQPISLHTFNPKGDDGPEQALSWGRHPLAVGDTVTIKILNRPAGATDEPEPLGSGIVIGSAAFLSK